VKFFNRSRRAAGPDWLGIGAQRSGTTWFTDLLVQHPGVGLGSNGKKEQHLLHKVGDGLAERSEYLDLFPGDEVKRGEWTPQYLRHASAPATAASLLRDDVPILVLLRDPIERYLSAMRLKATRGGSPWPYPVPMTVQAFSGFYAEQLAMWRSAFARERFEVLVYEDVRADPQAAADRVWRRLGLEPVALRDVEKPSGSSSTVSYDAEVGVVAALQAAYGQQARRLEDEWGLDLTRWSTGR
jgi:hypothetical protein